MSQGSRIYTDRITLNPPIDAPGDGEVNLYAVEGTPNGVLDANAGDRAWEIGSSNKWVCTGGTTWVADNGSGAVDAPGWNIILRPAGVEDEATGVYTTWATAFAAAEVIDGEVTLWVDSPGVAVVVPVDTYDFENITLKGWYYPDATSSAIQAQHILTTSEGVVFSNCFNGWENIQVNHTAATTPLCTFTCPVAPGMVTARTGVRSMTQALGAAPVYTFVAGAGVVGQLIVEPLSRVGDGSNDAVLIGAGVTLVFRNNSATLADDCISGAVGTTLSEVTQFGVLPTLAGFLGTRTTLSTASLLPYTPATPANWSSPPTTIQAALDAIANNISPV